MQPDQCIKFVCIILTARDSRVELLLTAGVFSTILLAMVVGGMLVIGAVLLGLHLFKSPMQGVIRNRNRDINCTPRATDLSINPLDQRGS